MQLNGVKVFGEELPKAASYAATLARCAGSGLHRLFDGLLRSECGRYEEADDFSFYEEGGYSANIHGETVRWERPPSCARWRCGCRGTST